MRILPALKIISRSFQRKDTKRLFDSTQYVQISIQEEKYLLAGAMEEIYLTSKDTRKKSGEKCLVACGIPSSWS
ncbi:hypothetical protein WN944_009375 [Citrus x changshan-huyou]|uniref:Uncharacterized protein n=1 Tax=Citrus x changshan-huyou TaxID=2935761 RepID=A0AAP0MPS5_9ROSI